MTDRTQPEALQQVYDARQLEIDHLRGATKMMEPAQPVAWLVYLPSIDTQNFYESQDDIGYLDDLTNHADAEVIPLYPGTAPKAEVAPAGEYPPLPEPWIRDLSAEFTDDQEHFHADQMRAYVDADRSMRVQADSVLEDAARLDWLDQQCEAYGFQDIHEGNRWEISGPYANVRIAIDAARAAKEGDPQ